jgi:cytochrome c oxidase assembly protein subunit 15
MVKLIADVYIFESKQMISRRSTLILVSITAIQMISAGLMAGMKAGIFFPSWPSMNGHFIPEILNESNSWSWANMANYDGHLFAPALVQFIHRNLAYLIVLLTIWCFFFYRKKVEAKSLFWLNSLLPLVFIQVFLGIFTVLHVKGFVPLYLGVAHQLVGLLFLISLLFFWFSLRCNKFSVKS